MDKVQLEILIPESFIKGLCVFVIYNLLFFDELSYPAPTYLIVKVHIVTAKAIPYLWREGRNYRLKKNHTEEYFYIPLLMFCCIDSNMSFQFLLYF